MARTREGQLLTELHRRQQVSLRAGLMRDVVAFYRLWELKDPASYAAMERALIIVARDGGMQAAALAANYYEAFRAFEVPTARLISIPLAAPPPDEQIRAAIAATAKHGVLRGLQAGQPYEQAMANGLVEVSGAVTRLALNTGRETIQQGVKRDPEARGWSRVTSGDACAFCAMLASRGPVYKEDTVDFEAHDHCSCASEPFYSGSSWPPESMAYRELWDETGSLNSFRTELRNQRAGTAPGTGGSSKPDMGSTQK
jgi:hypothetical protein